MSGKPRARRGGTPSLVRADPSGAVRGSLAELILAGRELRARLQGLLCETELARERERIEAWRIECLRAVAEGFEREAVQELAAALSRPPRPGREALVRMHRRRVSDALELIEALESTLGRQARSERRERPAVRELAGRVG